MEATPWSHQTHCAQWIRHEGNMFLLQQPRWLRDSADLTWASSPDCGLDHGLSAGGQEETCRDSTPTQHVTVPSGRLALCGDGS